MDVVAAICVIDGVVIVVDGTVVVKVFAGFGVVVRVDGEAVKVKIRTCYCQASNA